MQESEKQYDSIFDLFTDLIASHGEEESAVREPPETSLIVHGIYPEVGSTSLEERAVSR